MNLSVYRSKTERIFSQQSNEMYPESDTARCVVASFPVPRAAFRRLQYGKAGRAWYISSRE